jgi:hypothetical protein
MKAVRILTMGDEKGQFSDTGHVHGSLNYSQRLSVFLLVVGIQTADGVQATGLFCAISLIRL